MQATNALCLHLWCLTQAANCLVFAIETRANSLLLARLPAESTDFRLARGRPTQMVSAMPQIKLLEGGAAASQLASRTSPANRQAATLPAANMMEWSKCPSRQGSERWSAVFGKRRGNGKARRAGGSESFNVSKYGFATLQSRLPAGWIGNGYTWATAQWTCHLADSAAQRCRMSGNM